MSAATALGAEPPERGVLSGQPARGRLLDRTVAVRAFGLLGPVEASIGMLAFLASFAPAGWRPGEPFPGGSALLAASGTTFATFVLAQTANAFACRSAVVPPWRLGWSSNRLLLAAASIELVVALTALLAPPLARALGQARPPPGGLAGGGSVDHRPPVRRLPLGGCAFRFPAESGPVEQIPAPTAGAPPGRASRRCVAGPR